MTLPRRMPALDGLRGVAILLVILTHASGGWGAALSTVQDTLRWQQTFALPSWLWVICSAAQHGVTLFFVVSAFTLTLSISGRGVDLRQFAWRRIARVGPGYWLAGIGYTLAAGKAARLWAPHGVSLSDFVVAALFGSAWQGGASFAVVPGGWSVSVEMTFYLALPLLIWTINGRIWRALALTAIAMALAQIKARHDIAAGTWSFFDYCNPVEQFPVFLCGIVAALAARRFDVPRLPLVAGSVIFVAVVVMPLLQIHEWHLLSHVSFGILSAVAVCLSAASPLGFFTHRRMVRLGEVSYSMYLVHFAVLPLSLSVSGWALPSSDWTTLVLHFTFTTLVSFAIATWTYRIVEQPFIRWAHRLSGQSRATIAA